MRADIRTDGRTELGEILTGLACRCDLFKKEVTCAVKTTEVYQLKNILCENLDLNITSVCMLKVTQQYGVVVTLYCRLLEFWVSSWVASSFEMSGNNHRTTRRWNRNNCFLNTKTGLKIVISFSAVSFPVRFSEKLPAILRCIISYLSLCLATWAMLSSLYLHSSGHSGEHLHDSLCFRLCLTQTHARTHTQCKCGEYSAATAG